MKIKNTFKSLSHDRFGLVSSLLPLIVSAQYALAGQIDDTFDGATLDTNIWIDLTEGPGAACSVSDGVFRAARQHQAGDKAGVQGAEAQALAPEKGKVLRLTIDFAPASSFTTKNNFFFGIWDIRGKNSILLQTGRAYGWGGWGVVITHEGKQQKSTQFSLLNALPSRNWVFEIKSDRVEVFYGDGKGPAERLYFDTKRDAPQEGKNWLIPVVAMAPVILDDQSHGLGDVIVDRVRFSIEPLSFDPVMLLPGNGLGDELILVSEGQARATIVVADTAAEKVRRAARDLRDTVRASTGVSLPILEESDPTTGPRVLVGLSAPVESLGVAVPGGTGFRDEGIVARRVGTDVVIAGNDEGPYNGTQDAVICFLNVALGADFYYPAPSGKVIPRHARLAVKDLDLFERPAFPCRGISGSPRNGNLELAKEWRRWNHVGGAAIEDRHVHMMIAPPHSYFKEHPEYYSEIRGKRSVSGSWQLCTTNPDVIKLAVERCRRMFDSDPTLQSCSVSNNDGGGMCTCAECRKLDEPDPVSGGARRIVTFANAVAREVAKTHPGKSVAFYAYLFTLEPPMDMKLEPNVIPVLADSGNCVFHSYDDADCGLAQDSRQRLARWAQISSKVKFYDYYGLYGDYMGLPFCNISRTIVNARYLRALDGLGFWYDAVFVPGPQGLHYWTALRVLWESDLTVENARRRFCDGLYGQASPAMQDYYRHLEDFCTGAGVHSTLVTWVVPGPLAIWTDRTFSALRGDLRRARSLVAQGSHESERVGDQSRLLDFARVFVDLKRAQRAYWSDETETAKAAYQELRARYIKLYREIAAKGLLSFSPGVLEAYAPQDLTPVRTDLKLTPTPRPPVPDPLSLSDPAWILYGRTVSYFVDADNFCGYPVTRAALTYDDRALYVRVVCHDPRMRLVSAREQKRDGDVWQDDCIRLSVAPMAEDGEDRRDFYVSVGGVCRDARNGDASWNSEWSAAVARSDRLGARRWAARLEIPWAALDLAGPPQELRANLFRRVTTTKVKPVQSWAPTFGPLDSTERYATITIGD